jgi:microcystin-dependent protein
VGLESGTFISDLVATNPPTTDSKQQGDDHLRLIKTVLKNTFPNATRPMNFPTVVQKIGSFSILPTEMNCVFMCNSGAGGTQAILPALVTSDSGWSCWIMKFGLDTNPILITPPSGVIVSGQFALGATRRCIPNVACQVLWNGSNWTAERAIDVPVGTLLDFDGTTVPIGFELPNGQTLGANYPDFLAAKPGGVTQNIQGRMVVMRESAASLITPGESGIDSTTVGAIGGVQSVALAASQMPAHVHPNALSDPGHAHTLTQPSLGTFIGFNVQTGGGANGMQQLIVGINPNTTGITLANASQGGDSSHSNMPPVMVLNKILVVE